MAQPIATVTEPVKLPEPGLNVGVATHIVYVAEATPLFVRPALNATTLTDISQVNSR